MNISIQNYKQSHLNSLQLKKNSMRNLQAVNTASIFASFASLKITN